MKASDIFGLIVRVTGFLITIWALYYVLAGIGIAVERLARIPQGEVAQYSPWNYFDVGLPALLFGVLLFLFADFVVKLAYRGQQP